ncbi:MAG: hypothetical protein AAF525_19155, partial [Pseudomonadota bacterium]
PLLGTTILQDHTSLDCLTSTFREAGRPARSSPLLGTTILQDHTSLDRPTSTVPCRRMVGPFKSLLGTTILQDDMTDHRASPSYRDFVKTFI